MQHSGIAGDVEDRILMLGVMSEPRKFQIDQAANNLSRRHGTAERYGPAFGDGGHRYSGIAIDFSALADDLRRVVQHGLAAHRTPPWVSVTHTKMASASASLSSAGSKPRARMAAITVALSALP